MTSSPDTPGADAVLEFRQAFTAALAEAVQETGQLAVWTDGPTLPWVQQAGGDGSRGYWITCQITPGKGAHLDVTYLAPGTGSALLADRAADLTLTGTGARNVRILAAAAVTAIRSHQQDQQRTTGS